MGAVLTDAYRRHRGDIEALLDPRFYRIEHVDSEVSSGNWRVFGNDTAVILTEVRNYPTGAQVIHGIVAAGELPDILRLIEQAEAWAIESGCIAAEISSREGWSRILADRGYAVHQVAIRKELV